MSTKISDGEAPPPGTHRSPPCLPFPLPVRPSCPLPPVSILYVASCMSYLACGKVNADYLDYILALSKKLSLGDAPVVSSSAAF